MYSLRLALTLFLVVVMLAAPIASSLGEVPYYNDARYEPRDNPAGRYFRPLVGGIVVTIAIPGGDEPPEQPRGIYEPADTPYGRCTLGYPVKKLSTGKVGFIIAKHCYPTGVCYGYQPTYVDYNYIGQSQRFSYSVDAAFLETYARLSKKILHIYSPSGAYNLKPIKGKVPWNDQSYIDEVIYKTGYSTGTTSGILSAYYRYKNIGNRMLEYVVAITGMTSARGDSGAPVYWIHPEFGDLYVVGHLVAGSYSTKYAVHWQGPRAFLGVVPLTTG